MGRTGSMYPGRESDEKVESGLYYWEVDLARKKDHLEPCYRVRASFIERMNSYAVAGFSFVWCRRFIETQ